jgi:limonene-1,2-epoxide hydrolase
MESTLASERDSAGNGRAGLFSEATTQFSNVSRGSEHTASEVSERNVVAMDWQTGREVSNTERPTSDVAPLSETDGSATVERISTLLLREASLVKKHGSDSMAVVLRPDAETELFVHLSQRDGQVEASVRCERGDAQHLGALWSQLQESLAGQKVRLAPLESSPSAQSNFSPPPHSQSGGGQNGTRQETRPEKQSMDEWPAPPASQTGAPHVRGAGGTRGRRTTTSRPGWETWA